LAERIHEVSPPKSLKDSNFLLLMSPSIAKSSLRVYLNFRVFYRLSSAVLV
jgi:hypothetical protein